MPSFMVFALWVGTNSSAAQGTRETAIIPENMNQSKGLLTTLVGCQGLERTGFFGDYCFFIELKNSSLFLVARSLSRRNSVASSSSMPNRSFRRIHTLASISGGISHSSRRVPERFTLSDG